MGVITVHVDDRRRTPPNYGTVFVWDVAEEPRNVAMMLVQEARSRRGFAIVLRTGEIVEARWTTGSRDAWEIVE